MLMSDAGLNLLSSIRCCWWVFCSLLSAGLFLLTSLPCLCPDYSQHFPNATYTLSRNICLSVQHLPYKCNRTYIICEQPLKIFSMQLNIFDCLFVISGGFWQLTSLALLTLIVGPCMLPRINLHYTNIQNTNEKGNMYPPLRKNSQIIP